MTPIFKNLSTQPEALPEAYERVRPEMERLSEAELIHINLDVPAAVTTVLGAWPEIQALREQLAKRLPDFDMEAFDKLETYAMAAGHAHTRYSAAKAPPASLPELAEDGQRIRAVLLADATALATRGLLDATPLRELRNAQGYREIAFDLFKLVHVMRDSWDAIAGKTAIQPAELVAAQQLGERLVAEIGHREQAPSSIAAATLDRQRAYTLFYRTYDEVRRALSYLRWQQDDVDEIAPSLFAGRGGRPRAVEPKPQVAQPAPVTPSASAQPASTQPAPTAPTVGLPDSPAFTR